jgi:hypothetical protein
MIAHTIFNRKKSQSGNSITNLGLLSFGKLAVQLRILPEKRQATNQCIEK